MHLFGCCPTRPEQEFDPLKAIEVENSQGSGNVLTIENGCDFIVEVFTGFGERGVFAETVEQRTVTSVQD
jgi:RNA 3'-terminal phosphate cyclase